MLTLLSGRHSKSSASISSFYPFQSHQLSIFLYDLNKTMLWCSPFPCPWQLHIKNPLSNISNIPSATTVQPPVSDCTFYIQFSPPVCTFLHSSPLFLPLVNISFHYSHFSYCSSECNYYTSDSKVIRSSSALFSFMIPPQQKRRKKVAFLLIAPQESESSHCAASF